MTKHFYTVNAYPTGSTSITYRFKTVEEANELLDALTKLDVPADFWQDRFDNSAKALAEIVSKLDR